METKLQIGLRHKIEKTVQKEDTALVHGSGMIEVFATPAMIALMEKTACESVLQYLQEGFNTVGTHVNINHIKATAVGKKVFCESELVEIDNRKLSFKLVAFDEYGEIGNGTHTRFIIDVDKFMNKL